MVTNGSLPKIAVVGMSARTAGATDLAQLWENVRAGRESITRWTAPEAAVPGRVTLGAHGIVADSDCFDAGFFGVGPEEARTLDPQHRVFLEETWHALEHAGYPPDRCHGQVGVFASSGASRYWSQHVERGRRDPSSADLLDARLGNDKDFLAARVAYLLNLRGPVFTVQTACSSSLVAIHLAVQNLVTYQADLVVAGGVSLTLPGERGYTLEQGSVLSADGHCRPFDAAANGTVPGDGVGVVVLKRLSDAIEDKDLVHAVIAGSAMNNDGREKVGFTAPSLHGQVDVIRQAAGIAGVPPDSFGYVEAHGTATALGDRIELAALREAFGDGLAHRTCALGSLKANIGHTDAAAGVLGFIKAVLCVRDGIVPPMANFSKASDEIGSEGSPFFVPENGETWPNHAEIRSAGVTSLGMGGTNVHVVVQQGPVPRQASEEDASPRILVLSAKSADGLARYCTALAAGLDEQRSTPLASVAATLRNSRSTGPWRYAQVASSVSEAAVNFRLAASERQFGHGGEVRPVLMFSGQGIGLGQTARTLAEIPQLRQYFDRACAELSPLLGRDAAELVVADDPALETTALAQPVLFALQYAASRWLGDLGVAPVAVVGHSVGEFAAAVVSGVLSFEDALSLVVARGRAMQDAPEGRMAAISLGAAEIRRRLPERCAIASVNAPFLCVVAGPEEPMAEFVAAVRQDGVRVTELASRRAFHSSMMSDAAAEFRGAFGEVRWGAPETPLGSTLTGTLAGPELLADPEYWVRQIVEPVRFADAVESVAPLNPTCWLEVGPGRALQTFAAASEAVGTDDLVTGLGSSWREPVAALWQRGADLRWDVVADRPVLAELPGYPFARDRHWIDVAAPAGDERPARTSSDEVPKPNTNGEHAPRTRPEVTGAVGRDLLAELTAIWKDVLGVAEVAPYDDFFEYGHSLAAVRLVARVREQISPAASLEAFFNEPTFDSLRRQIETADRELVRVGEPVSAGHARAVPVGAIPPSTTEFRPPRAETTVPRSAADEVKPGLSVIFFSAPVDEVTDNSYEVVLRTAKVADELGFEAIWTPERHFHSFGGAYPNPAVLGAAVAAVTERVGIRAGSVVLPLHNPISVAEEWAVVDQISAGRVAISFATGWHPIDFSFAPDKFANRYEVLERDMETVRRLWRGEAIEVRTGDGRTELVHTFPRPAQPELPVWISAASSEDSFARAGRLGANVLTALLSLSVDDLADRVRTYRQAREDAGLDPASGRVTVMAHTFIGESREHARRVCEEPLKQYILEHSELLRSMGGGLQSADLKTVSPQDRDFVLSRAFDKYFGDRGLMGDADDADRIMKNLVAAGADEVAALVDFGLSQDQIEESLTRLAAVRAARR